MFDKNQQEQNAAMLDMDMQQEEVLAFFRDYWKPILGIAIALVLITAGLQIYRAQSARVAGEQMAALLPLASAPPTIANAKALEDFAAAKATGSRRAITLLYAAAQYESIGKPDDARRVLTATIDSSPPEEIKDYARVLLVNMGGDAKTLDQVDKNSAWQTAVSEIRALAEPDAQKRRDNFAVIMADPHSPSAMHARAAEFSGQSGEDQ
jgi:hypothetical protein